MQADQLRRVSHLNGAEPSKPLKTRRLSVRRNNATDRSWRRERRVEPTSMMRRSGGHVRRDNQLIQKERAADAGPQPVHPRRPGGCAADPRARRHAGRAALHRQRPRAGRPHRLLLPACRPLRHARGAAPLDVARVVRQRRGGPRPAEGALRRHPRRRPFDGRHPRHSISRRIGPPACTACCSMRRR